METTALLQHDDSPTAVVAAKLRTLMQVNALKRGYMPSTEQIEQHIAAVVRSPMLSTSQRGLGRPTKAVLSEFRLFVKTIGLLVKEKNEGDLVQEIISNLKHASIQNDLDGDVFSARLDLATAKADAKTAHVKAKAIADVLYSNPQFRALLHDGSILARDVLSDVVEATATAIAPEEQDLIQLEREAVDVDGRAIKDDVDETKERIQGKVDNVKRQLREKYDEATASAVETLQDLQARGQSFSQDAQQKAAELTKDAQRKTGQLVEQGKAVALEVSGALEQKIDAALEKIAEVSGLDSKEIRKQLDQGILIEDLLQKAKFAAENAKEKTQEGLKQADLQAGQALTNAKSALAHADQDAGRLASKTKDVAKELDKSAGQALQKTKDNISATVDSENVNEKVQAAQDKGQDIVEQTEKTAQKSLAQAQKQTKSLTTEATTTPEISSSSKSSKQDLGGSNGGHSHLQELGIIHPQLELSSTESSKKPDSEPFLVENIVTQIKSKVNQSSKMSTEDLENIARSLIKDMSKTVDNAKAAGENLVQDVTDKSDGLAQESQRKASEVSDSIQSGSRDIKGKASPQVSKQISKAQDNGSKFVQQAEVAVDEAGKMADAGSSKAQQIIENVKAKFENTSVADLEELFQDYLSAARKKVEDVSGISEQDLDNAADELKGKTKNLAKSSVEKGKTTASAIREKSGEMAADLQERTAEISNSVEKGAVTVASQAKHTLQNAERGSAGQIHETMDASQALVDNTIAAIDHATIDIRKYLEEKFPASRRAAIQRHFRGLMVSLRDNTDYSNGLDGLISVSRKYVAYTMTFVDAVPSDAGEIVETNQELDQAVRMTLQLIERFSNGVGFRGVQTAYQRLSRDLKKEKNSGDFIDDCMTYFKKIVQDMKYAASHDAEKHGNLLLARVDEFAEDTGIKRDIDQLFREVVYLAEGFAADETTVAAYHRGHGLVRSLMLNDQGNFVFKKRLMKDFFNVLMPSALKLVQYIPISRVEYQDADVDLLIENLVLESSASHDQSFLPYKIRVENNNTIEFLNAYKFESDYSQQLTIKIEGLTLAVRDAGFYIRKKTGFWRFTDTGLLDVIMDGNGLDVDIDIQMSTDDEEADVTKDALFIVKDVRVKLHKFDFSTSGAKHGWLIGLVKPFIKGFVKRQIALAVEAAITEQMEYYEYQLRMFKHRIQTAYIANNGQASFASFFQAIFTANAGNASGRKGQFEVVVGGTGPLRGIHTKASLEHELEYRDDIVAEEGHGPASWRSDIFDFHV